MNLHKVYISLLTADLVAAERWYGKFFGRGPDHRPMGTLVQWEFSDHSGLMLSDSDEIASRGAAFFYVADLEVERERLRDLEIMLGDDIAGDYSTLAQVRDPDGNLLTLATLPRRSFPAA
jgi:predicted enzyme related to lactoylglutathione lyase